MTPTTVQDAASIDPFDLEFLENPHTFHAMLRDAAPVVRLEKYGVYAMARYAEVHAALVDWQSFQSATGVGLSNFRTEKPWRPPSVLLEADPPRHDAPRAVVAPLLTTRRLRDLEDQWRADAATLVAELLERGTAFDAVTDLAEVFPLRVFPDAVGIGTEGRENLLPYGDFAFNAFGISRKDLERLGDLQRRYFAELRAIVAVSPRTEAFAVATFQLFHLAREP